MRIIGIVCFACRAERSPLLDVAAPVRQCVAQQRMTVERRVGGDQVRDQIAVPN